MIAGPRRVTHVAHFARLRCLRSSAPECRNKAKHQVWIIQQAAGRIRHANGDRQIRSAARCPARINSLIEVVGHDLPQRRERERVIDPIVECVVASQKQPTLRQLQIFSFADGIGCRFCTCDASRRGLQAFSLPWRQFLHGTPRRLPIQWYLCTCRVWCLVRDRVAGPKSLQSAATLRAYGTYNVDLRGASSTARSK
jgi:hypothetical protein